MPCLEKGVEDGRRIRIMNFSDKLQKIMARIIIPAVMTILVYAVVHAEAAYTLKIATGPDDSQNGTVLIIMEDDVRGYRLRASDDGREMLDILLTRKAARSLKQLTACNLQRKMTFFWKNKELGSDRITRVISNGVISLMVSNWDVLEMKADLKRRALLESGP